MAGRYKILEELGAGGVGKVFKAYDTQLDRYVALKRLLSREEAERDDSQAAVLRKEAASLATLQHPNIVTVYDLGADEEGTFIVMELLEGETLGDWVRGGTLGLADFYELASQTLEGVLTAHAQSILHRDLKPENIKVRRMPGGRLQAKIVDFGLARLSYGAKKQTEDQRGNVLGSIFYMAPEQFQRKPLDGRTDLYSLGCVYYQVLCGSRPFQAATMAGVMQMHLDHQVTLLHDVRPDLPSEVCDWVMWLMNSDPQDRPANAQQALDTLRALAAEGKFVESAPAVPVARAISAPVRPATGVVPRAATSTAPARPGSASVPVPSGAGRVIQTTGLIEDDDDSAAPLMVAPEEPARRGVPIWVWGAAAAAGVVLAGGAWFFLSGKSPEKAAATQNGGASASSQDVNGAPLPAGLLVNGFIIHWSAAQKAEAWTESGKAIPASPGAPVVTVHDLAPAAGDGALTAYERKQENCPKLLVEQTSGLKVPVAMLRFELGQCMMHRMDVSKPESQSYPFGGDAPGKGCTLIALFRPRILQKDIRILRLRSQEKDDLVDVFATAANEFKIRVRINGKFKDTTITNRNTAIFSLITVALDGATNKLMLTVRGQDGGKNHVEIDAPPGCHTLNEIRFSEYSKDPAHPVGDGDKISGDLAEVILWPLAMDSSTRTLMEQKIAEYYFTNPGTRYN